MNRLLRHLLALPLLLVAAFGASAQEETYKFDFGAGIGMSGYLGDVNQVNMFRNPGFAAQVGFRYLIDTRWTVRTALTTAALKGNSAQYSNKFPGLRDYSFSARAYALDVRGEFNFLPYGIGETFKRLKRWTPYMALGVGAVFSHCGQSNAIAFELPLAAGFKFKLRERLNLALEFSMAKAIGDRLDGNISDLQGIKSDFIKNTDWHSQLLVSITYEFGKRCETCHYKD